VSGSVLVAGRQDSTGALDGFAIAEDISALVSGVRSGNWIDAAIGGVATGMDTLAMVFDPIGALASMGIAWLMEHIQPLKQALDSLAGDPGQISAFAQTWQNVATQARASGAELQDAVSRQAGSWTGAAATAYQRHARSHEAALEGIAEGAGGIAEIVQGAGMLVATVRGMVRDLIADCISTLLVRLPIWAAEAGVTLGVATPVIVAQVSALVAKWAARIGKLLKALVNSIQQLVPIIRRLGELIDTLKELLRRLRSHGHVPDAPEHVPGAYGGRNSRPRNMADFMAQDEWANRAYDHIRANPDSDVIAGHLKDLPRRDGSTGFTEAEVEQIRQHVFFEEHPLDDYDGGIVHRRYDADPDMADAWLRLRSGRPLPEDIALLEHELFESNYLKSHPEAAYREAHLAANEVSKWEDQIPSPTREDFEEGWR
jgi:uncharacterized protein YukE